ncbi:MAG: DUF2116 family Zn-ribbon domain-containing protein [Candidatus Thermoplasmatota archaeon]|nr:DUF2116 family Zn-ribbon domain-containing protein [Candidatus Thermoplasmatota archaeon]MBU1940818.1 DUF2116 family Zn-ribbon domain-containing protein [Candidatus Thermoplasmatota archaeon]
MPHVRNYYHRPITCPLCQKTIENENQWFCSQQCEEEWNKLNGDLKKSNIKHVKGRDTSS